MRIFKSALIHARVFGHCFLVCMLMISFFGCRSPEPAPSPGWLSPDREKRAFHEIEQLSHMVKSGDLVLRNGRDFTSRLMRDMSRFDKSFSHCGIANLENDTLFVYHIIGGALNPDQKMRRDPFALFCNPYESDLIGVYRYDLPDNDRTGFLRRIDSFYRSGISFDLDFDLESDEKMYCSEMVYKALRPALPAMTEFTLSAYKNKKYVSIDDLYLRGRAREIKRIGFKN